MAKLLYIPVSIAAALIARSVAGKVFDQVWGFIDNEHEAPDSKHRDIQWSRLLLAGAIQGVIFKIIKEATDHSARRAFYRATGSWPGEDSPAPK